MTPIIVALDYPDISSALALADRLDPSMCRLKVGKELFTSAGPVALEQLHQRGFEVFLDLKFHDIPNTTSKAVKAAAELGVWMVNVHASGGRRMMEACCEELGKRTEANPLLIAVTVLTSMERQDLLEIGLDVDPEQQVRRLATLTKDSGFDGVVCSAQEVGMLRDEIGEEFSLVTPGIRPQDSERGDQRRVVTPQEAIAMGSSYLVIGRPITQADDPGVALREIVKTLN